MATPTLSGTQFQVNTGTTSSTQDSPHVATLSDGRLVVVWRDIGTSSSTLKFKILNVDGSQSVAETVLNTGQTSTGFVGSGGGGDYLSVAGLSNGGFAATWMYRTSPTFDEDVFYKVFNASGVGVTGNEIASNSTVGNQQDPDIVRAGDGFYIAWEDFNDGETGVSAGSAVMARDFDNSGAPGLDSGRISSANGGDGDPSLAFNNSNFGLLAVFDDDLGEDGIFGNETGPFGYGFFRADATLGSPAVPFHSDPDVAYNTTGSFLTVWSHYTGTPGVYEVRGSFNNSASTSKINTTATPFSTMSPQVVALQDGGWGGWIVFWADGGSDDIGGTDWDVVGQRYTSAGSKDGGEFVVTSASVVNNNLSTLEATLMLDGRVLVTWEAGGPTTSGTEIYSQFVDPRTAPVTLTGTGIGEQLGGTTGNDTLNGGGGNDRLFGFDGNDTLNGDANNDVLFGGNGNDFLNGGAGNDTMTGGAGNDTYRFDTTADVAIEAANGGTDLVRALVNIGALGANLENVVMDGISNLLVIGNTLANSIIGNGGNNQLRGLAGNDGMNGGAGNDILIGGTGRDLMAGGLGADDFHFDALADLGKGATRDLITDFVKNIDDLDFNTMDANSVAAGNQNFLFRGTGAFSGAGQLRYFLSAGGAGTADDKTIVQGNLDNNLATIEFEVELKGLIGLGAADIIL